MNEILLAVIIVASIGLILGIVLAIASIIMAVKKDEKVEALIEVLPSANCGACGYSGCSGYAKSLAHENAELTLCTVGGEEVAKEISKILGVESSGSTKTTAIVNCMGTKENTTSTMNYQGINTCKALTQLHLGDKSCRYGCLGAGDCKTACDFGAITICNGVAVIDKDKCKSCKKCVTACPKNLITIIEDKPSAVVLCNNCDKGALTRKDCKAGCIGCMKCKKVCEVGAVTITSFNATIDTTLCIGCNKCVDACPQKCIQPV